MSRRLLIALGVLLVCGIGAAPASAYRATYHDSADGVSATVRWVVPGYPRESYADLVIKEDGEEVFNADVSPGECRGACGPIDYHAMKAIRVTNLDSDPEPEILLSATTMGAHCCVIAKIIDRTDNGYRGEVYDFGDAGYDLDLLRPGERYFVTADARFAYRFAAYAFSGFPLEIRQYRGGRFADVTQEFPGRLRRDARRWWGIYKDAVRHPRSEPVGAIAPWAADEYLLGRRGHANAVLRHQLRLGHLHNAGYPPHDRRFVRRLRRTLRQLGYA